MKFPAPTSSLWPSTPAQVLAIAHNWYDASRVAVDDKAIAALELPSIQVGAEASITTGKMGLDFLENIKLSIALNSINYQFWDQDPSGEFIRYAHEGVVGAMGMVQAFERAWFDPESPLTRARQGTPLVVEDIHAIFGDIPAAKSRADILNEVLTSPDFSRVARQINTQVNQGGAMDTALAQKLADAFPLAYGDPVLKKAQLAVSEVWVKAREAGVDMECDLTAFADYQIPNILRALGVLTYSPSLAGRIDAMQPIEYDSKDERAIRAASLIAVEHIARQAGAPVAAVDHYLWTRRKEATTPFHLTFTTAY